MKRFLLSMSLTVILLSAAPAFATPPILRKVAENREFLARFTGYENCYLYDVSKISDGRVGLILLSPLGFEIRLVLETRGGETVYKDMFVPEKSKRTAMRRESVSIADAMKLARSAMAYERGKDGS